MKSAGFSISALILGMTSWFGASSVMAADMPTKAPVKVAVAAPPVDAWSFQVTPYFWAAGLKGDVQLGPRAPMTHVDASFSDILDHLKFAAMGLVELRRARFGVVADVMYLSLSASATGPLGFVNAELKNKTFVGTFNAAYRAIDSGSWWLDIEAGARVWSINNDLRFDIVPLGASLTYSSDKSWADPIIGVRARANLGQGFFVQGYADIGGFGLVSDSTWQLAGLFGYQYSPKTSIVAGYRYMAVDYTNNGFVWDVKMSGPIFAATFQLN